MIPILYKHPLHYWLLLDHYWSNIVALIKCRQSPQQIIISPVADLLETTPSLVYTFLSTAKHLDLNVSLSTGPSCFDSQLCELGGQGGFRWPISERGLGLERTSNGPHLFTPREWALVAGCKSGVSVFLLFKSLTTVTLSNVKHFKHWSLVCKQIVPKSCTIGAPVCSLLRENNTLFTTHHLPFLTCC